MSLRKCTAFTGCSGFFMMKESTPSGLFFKHRPVATLVKNIFYQLQQTLDNLKNSLKKLVSKNIGCNIFQKNSFSPNI